MPSCFRVTVRLGRTRRKAEWLPERLLELTDGSVGCFTSHGGAWPQLLTAPSSPAADWQSARWSHEAGLTGGRMAERDVPLGAVPLQSSSEASESSGRQNSSDENGHVDSPDETLSPTSVIYFKEALNSSNLTFGKAVSLSPSPLRQYDFRIERIESKRRSKCRRTFEKSNTN